MSDTLLWIGGFVAIFLLGVAAGEIRSDYNYHHKYIMVRSRFVEHGRDGFFQCIGKLVDCPNCGQRVDR